MAEWVLKVNKSWVGKEITIYLRHTRDSREKVKAEINIGKFPESEN